MAIKAGDDVEVRRRNGKRVYWKPGKVLEVRGGKVANIKLEHKSNPQNVRLKDVRLRHDKPVTHNFGDELKRIAVENRKKLIESIMLELKPPFHMNAVYNNIPNGYSMPFVEFRALWESVVYEGTAVYCQNGLFRHIDQELPLKHAKQPEPKAAAKRKKSPAQPQAEKKEEDVKAQPYKRFSLYKETQVVESTVVLYQHLRDGKVHLRAAVLVDDRGNLAWRSIARREPGERVWEKAETRRAVDPTNYKIVALMPPLLEENICYSDDLRRLLEDEYIRLKEELEGDRIDKTRKKLVKEVSKKLDKLDPAALAQISAILAAQNAAD